MPVLVMLLLLLLVLLVRLLPLLVVVVPLMVVVVAVVVVVALELRSLGFGFRAGREATRVNKLLLLPGRVAKGEARENRKGT